MSQPPSPPPASAAATAGSPQLSRLMLATLALTVIVGLPVDKIGGVAGQQVVNVWSWAVFLLLVARINQPLRLPLVLCLVISTIGECCLSLAWGLYVYWHHNIPLFVPPGHVMLFTLGLAFAPRLPRWFVVLLTVLAAGYGTTAFLTSSDTFSTALAILFVIFVVVGRNRQLYATMFVVALLMELYGTWIGNWAWVPDVPGLPLSSANPPLCVGVLYCGLDLLVVNADRAIRRWRP